MEFDPNKPVGTNGGLKARVLCTNLKGKYSIVAVIEELDGSETVDSFTSNGKQLVLEEPYVLEESIHDLVNIT